MSDLDGRQSRLARVASSETFASLGRAAAVLCVPLIIWVLSTTVDYGKQLTAMDVRIATLTVQIVTLTTQLQADAATRYTSAEAAKDLGYRDREIKEIRDHVVDTENSLYALKDRVSKVESRR